MRWHSLSLGNDDVCENMFAERGRWEEGENYLKMLGILKIGEVRLLGCY